MELIEVELIVDTLEDREQKKERKKGDKWYVTNERLEVLLGNNHYNKAFVQVTGKIKTTEIEEEPKIEEVKKKKKK